MLNQSKEKIANLESDLKDAHEELSEMREKMDARNARIARKLNAGLPAIDRIDASDWIWLRQPSNFKQSLVCAQSR